MTKGKSHDDCRITVGVDLPAMTDVLVCLITSVKAQGVLDFRTFLNRVYDACLDDHEFVRDCLFCGEPYIGSCDWDDRVTCQTCYWRNLRDACRLHDSINSIKKKKAPHEGDLPRELSDFTHLLCEHKEELESFIYFLVDDEDRVAYVGQTINLTARIRQHRSDKRFHRVFFFPAPHEVRENLERALIRWFKPYLNVVNAADDVSENDLKVIAALLAQKEQFFDPGLQTTV